MDTAEIHKKSLAESLAHNAVFTVVTRIVMIGGVPFAIYLNSMIMDIRLNLSDFRSTFQQRVLTAEATISEMRKDIKQNELDIKQLEIRLATMRAIQQDMAQP
jgi:hypothetical protein